MSLFPTRHYADCGEYADDYFDTYHRASALLDRSEIHRASALFREVVERGGTVFVCGNGGSAAISNHLTCDCLKGVRNGTDIKPNVYSLASTVELITAIANDFSYDQIFSFQLESHANAGDLLIVISSSGGSPNIVQALRCAKEMGVQTIAMTGFDGGAANELADVKLWVKAHNYGVVEDIHQSLMHILAQHTRQQYVDRESIGKIKF
ncbi:Phosphoheptose isomerase 1 [Candidatus Burkholderia verschuerenii]|uniref:Phosphoheptose isomerase 1 n=1 Tax=Candidatus Burkholderia verschuerenii TaxID=242163 RepID=A0A0L0MFF1_9BURK|nr:Phosphoheptose isomerase 1 [Candidatus Burkholderia verschuerenii]